MSKAVSEKESRASLKTEKKSKKNKEKSSVGTDLCTPEGDEADRKRKTLKRKKSQDDVSATVDEDLETGNKNSSNNRSEDNVFEESSEDEKSDYLPVEPEAISRKEKRKRRKLQSLGRSEVDEEPPKESLSSNSANQNSSQTRTKPSQVESIFTTNSRSQYSVWVGNMLFTTQGQELYNFFDNCGKITRIKMPSGKRSHENNKGFAYVDFETKEGQENALKKTEGMLGGRKLLIKKANDYTGRPIPTKTADEAEPNSRTSSSSVTGSSNLSKSAQRILQRQKQPPAPCIYLGNLGFEATEEKIQKMFEDNFQKSKTNLPNELENSRNTENDQVGIRKVRMGTFEDSGKCKGFAFVDFKTVKQATNALLDTRNHSMDGRYLTIEYASQDAVRRGGGAVKPIKNSNSSKASSRKVSEEFSSSSRPQTYQGKSEIHFNHSQYKNKKHGFGNVRENEGSLEQTSVLNEHDEEAEQVGKKFLSTNKSSTKTAFKGRQTPGAALANAKRASVGIVKNPTITGTKIVFS